MRFSKKMVITIVMLNVVAFASGLFVCYHTMQPIDALVVAWFGFTTVELWELSKIKREENRRVDAHGEHCETIE